MSFDDDSLLSAYLDGQLDPSERQAVESSLTSDPSAAEKLRGLLVVRDLISELSRPTAADISPEVMRRIGELGNRRRPWSAVRRALPWMAACVAGAAAGLLILMAFDRFPIRPAAQSVPERSSPNAVASTAGVGKTDTPSATVGRPDTTSPVGQPRDDSERLAAAPQVNIPPGAQHVEAAGDGKLPDVQAVRALLDDPRLRHVFMVTDVIEDPARKVVEQSTRQDYYRITVSQGIVIDPKHPEKATVFALVLDETQIGLLRGRLKEAFKDQVEEHEIDPGVVTQLADICQVVTLPPHPVGDVQIPVSPPIALRTEGGPTLEQERSAPIVPSGKSARLEQDIPPANPKPVPGTPRDKLANRSPRNSFPFEGGGAARPVEPINPGLPDAEAAPNPGAIARDTERGHPVVVLVWVTHPRSG